MRVAIVFNKPDNFGGAERVAFTEFGDDVVSVPFILNIEKKIREKDIKIIGEKELKLLVAAAPGPFTTI